MDPLDKIVGLVHRPSMGWCLEYMLSVFLAGAARRPGR